MNYSTIYVSMDVHEASFSLCCYTNEKEEAEYPQKVQDHYRRFLTTLRPLRFHYGDDALFICGYEAGCIGFTLYQRPDHHAVAKGQKENKTDKRGRKKYCQNPGSS